jgi:hypothetical protein
MHLEDIYPVEFYRVGAGGGRWKSKVYVSCMLPVLHGKWWLRWIYRYLLDARVPVYYGIYVLVGRSGSWYRSTEIGMLPVGRFGWIQRVSLTFRDGKYLFQYAGFLSRWNE